MKQFESRFSDLVYCTYETLADKGIEANRFHAYLMALDLSRSKEHGEFINNLFEPGTTFHNLWGRLCGYWNFLNFNLLEHVVGKFGSEDLKHKMESYVRDLQSFRKATRLCDFIDCWPVLGETPPKSDLRKFVVKMKHDWDRCTLEDLETLKGVITHKFFLPDFALRLKKIETGSIIITWFLPAPFVKTLQEAMGNTASDFFIEHKIETVTIDGQDCYPTPTSGYLTEQDTSEPAADISPPTPSEMSHPRLKQDLSEEGTVATSIFTKLKLSVTSLFKRRVHEVSTVPPSESQQLGDPPHAPSTSGYPGKHTREKYSTGFTSETSTDLSEKEGVLKPGKPLFEVEDEYSSIFPSEIQQLGDPLDMPSTSAYLKKLQGERYTSKTTLTHDLVSAKEYVRQKCVDVASYHRSAELLPSVEQYLSKAEVEADPSLPTKYRVYLSSTPAIRAAVYTPFNAKTSAEVFTWSQLTESPPPTTMTELFTTFTLKTLVGYLSTHPLYHKQQLKVTSFSDLPPDVYKQFMDLCRMAYEGILNRQQLVFSAAYLPAGFSPLGLMQEVPQVYTQGKASSYHFTHLTLQEFLSAIHISQLPANEQIKLILDYGELLQHDPDSGHFETTLLKLTLGSGHFKMTLRFVAGLTKLANISPDIASLRIDANNIVTLLHWLFECKDTSVATRTLGSNEITVNSHYWTPLDYYVTGHVISHSNCPWRLIFGYSSIDDEKFELFCQGCATPVESGCVGYISSAVLSYSIFTSKHMQSFVSIPPHVLQGMRELDLSGNKLDGRACDLLAKVVPSMSRLEVLLLHFNPIGRGGAVEVIKSLCGSGVKQLRLYDTGIGGPDCEALSELLQSTHSLEWLYIDQNNLSSESVASIITGLSHNNSLTKLDISDSRFSMGNTHHLSSLLREHSKCTLTSLVLQDCHISSEGAVELATALCKNTTLKILRLSGNPIGEHVEGVTAVATMLVENKSLTLLELIDCHISGQGAGELAAALCKNSTLQYLNLDRNPIGVEGASSMSDMLQHNTSLTRLYMCDDSVGEEGVHQLMNSVKYNQTLRELRLPRKYKPETSDHGIIWW